MYIGYEQIAVSDTVLSVSDLTIKKGATLVELQAGTQNVRYTMDLNTDPTAAIGMLLATTMEPKLFLIEDLKRIRFIRATGSDGTLNVHYVAGRNI